MSALEKLIEKIDALCGKIEFQREEIERLRAENRMLENSYLEKQEELSKMLTDQSNEEQKIEALFNRMERALNDNQ